MAVEMSQELDWTALAAPGCCVVLRSSSAAPLAFGALSLVVATTGQAALATVAAGLPPPSSFGARLARYALWLFGGGALRLQMTLGAAASSLGTVYAAGSGPLASTPLSEIAISAEPPASASITGPVVLTGSFGLCR